MTTYRVKLTYSVTCLVVVEANSPGHAVELADAIADLDECDHAALRHHHVEEIEGASEETTP